MLDLRQMCRYRVSIMLIVALPSKPAIKQLFRQITESGFFCHCKSSSKDRRRLLGHIWQFLHPLVNIYQSDLNIWKFSEDFLLMLAYPMVALVIFQVDDESNRLMDVAETCCMFTITLLIHPGSNLVFYGSGATDLDGEFASPPACMSVVFFCRELIDVEGSLSSSKLVKDLFERRVKNRRRCDSARYISGRGCHSLREEAALWVTKFWRRKLNESLRNRPSGICGDPSFSSGWNLYCAY